MSASSSPISRRVWLIGNGASLKQTPVELIQDDTIGVNKIGSFFMPTRYVKIDYPQFGGSDWSKEVIPMLGRPCLLWDVFRDGVKNPDAPFGDSIPYGLGEQDDVTWIPRCEHHGGEAEHWHEPVCTAYNSISVMAQWAEKLGYKEIILVGCDLNFTDGISDHFMPYYEKIDSEYQERNVRMVRGAHEFIKRNCKIPVFNATIGGSLETFPRVDFYNILKG